MANQSIFDAFERMWQHVVAALGDKSDTSHSHDEFESFVKVEEQTLTEEQKAQARENIGISGSDDSDIYIQNDEPTDAEEGSLWVDMDAVGTVGGGNGGSYSAEIPTFNLNELGLPIFTPDVQEVSVTDIDCTHIREALANGLIKVNFSVDPKNTVAIWPDQKQLNITHTVSGFYEANGDFYQVIVPVRLEALKQPLLWSVSFLIRVYTDKIVLRSFCDPGITDIASLEDANGYDVKQAATAGRYPYYLRPYAEDEYRLYTPSVIDNTSGFYNISLKPGYYYDALTYRWLDLGSITGDSEFKEFDSPIAPLGTDADIGKVLTWVGKDSVSGRGLDWVEPSGNNSSVNAVLYTAQTLTEEQKAQARANIGISETSETSEIPTFNLTEMGLPPVNYGSGEIVSVDTDAQSLLEALVDGPVKIKYQFYEDATSGQVVDSEVVVCANTFSEHDLAQATFITVTNEFFMNSLVVFSERITLGSTIASNGGSGNVPSAEGVGF